MTGASTDQQPSSDGSHSEVHPDLVRGLIGAAVAVSAWSTGTVLAKGIEMGGLAIGAYRFAFFSIAIVIWLWRNGTPFRFRILRDSMAGGIALGADIAFFFSAVKLTSIVNATVIGSLQPIVVGIVAARFFGEQIRSRDAMWALLALAGVVVVVVSGGSDSPSDWRGDLLAVGAMFSWSAYFIASRESRNRMTSYEFTAGTAIWTTAICIPLGFLLGQDMSWPSTKNILLILLMAATAGVVGHTVMNWSLVRIPLWVGSTFTLLIPVVSAILAWVFLDEPLSAAQAAAIAVVIGSLTMIVRAQSRPT